MTATQSAARPSLARSLTLLHATLYGLGVTIGAGIYVLVGVAAARGGMHAPLAFVIGGMLMALSAASFAELGGRFLLPPARLPMPVLPLPRTSSRWSWACSSLALPSCLRLPLASAARVICQNLFDCPRLYWWELWSSPWG